MYMNTYFQLISLCLWDFLLGSLVGEKLFWKCSGSGHNLSWANTPWLERFLREATYRLMLYDLRLLAGFGFFGDYIDFQILSLLIHPIRLDLQFWCCQLDVYHKKELKDLDQKKGVHGDWISSVFLGIICYS